MSTLSTFYHGILFSYHSYKCRKLYNSSGFQSAKFVYHRWRRNYHALMTNDSAYHGSKLAKYISSSLLKNVEEYPNVFRNASDGGNKR